MKNLIWTIIGVILLITFSLSGVLTFIMAGLPFISDIYNASFTVLLITGVAFLYLRVDCKKIYERTLFKMGAIILIISSIIKILYLPGSIIVASIGLLIMLIDLIIELKSKTNQSILDVTIPTSAISFLTGYASIILGLPKIGSYFLYSAILILWIGIISDLKRNGLPSFDKKVNSYK